MKVLGAETEQPAQGSCWSKTKKPPKPQFPMHIPNFKKVNIAKEESEPVASGDFSFK